MKFKGANIWIKRIGFIFLIPVLLVLLVAVLLYIPFIQNLAIKKVSQYASQSLGMRVDVGHIRLSFPLDLNVRDVVAIDAEQDTIIYSNELSLKVRLRPLLDKNISIQTVQLSDVRFNTKSLIKGMRISGYVGGLSASADRISLFREEALLNSLTLSDSDIKLRIDSIIPSTDTINSTVGWNLLLQKVQLQQVNFELQMPSDSIQVILYIEEALLTEGTVDLETAQYSASRFVLSDSKVQYNLGEQTVKSGFDPSHIMLSNINIGLDSIHYQGRNIYAVLQKFSANERSGLSVISMAGSIRSDENTLSVPQWSLQTPHSEIHAYITMPWSVLNKQPEGNMRTELLVALDRRDVQTILGDRAELIERFYPETMFKLVGLLEGNLEKIHIRKLESELPGLFKVSAHGIVEKIMDEAARSGEFYLTGQTQNEHFLRGKLLSESAGRYSLPDSLSINLQAVLSRGTYRADMFLGAQGGDIKLKAQYNPGQKEYNVNLILDNFGLVHFLPKDSIFSITAALNAEGKGFDFLANSTWTQFNGELTHLRYKETSISDITFQGALKNNQLQAHLISNYPYVMANMTVEGNVTKEKISGMIVLDMDSLDLYGLQLTKRPFSNSFQIFSELETDLNKRHLIDITLGNWEMQFGAQRVNPKTLTLHAKGTEDTTSVSFHTGDLGINLTGNADLETILDKFQVVSNDFMKQLEEDSTVNLQQLSPLLPEMHLRIAAERDNPVYNYLQTNNIFFDRFGLDATTSPERGIDANAFLYAFIKDTLKIDSVRFNLWQDSNKLNYTLDVVKEKFRKQEPFKAGLKGSFQYDLGDVEAYYLNGQGQTGLNIGARIEKQAEGINIRFFPEKPVIAFLPFTVNDGNYILFKSPQNILANLRMEGEEYASLWVHSLEEDNVMNELSVEVSQINLDRISAGFSWIPSLQGIANVALRYTPIDKTFMLVGEASVDNLIYQKGQIGELLMSGVYLPLDKSQHQVDMHIFHNQQEISSLSAIYQSTKDGHLDGTMHVNQLPLSIANPFLAGAAQMSGALQGTMDVAGTSKRPVLNGYLKMDTSTIYVTAAGSRLRLDEQRINVTDSRIHLNKYNIYSVGNNPFVIDGTVDIRDLSKGTADLRLTASSMQLLDSKKDKESLVYGRLFVDLNSTVKGPLNALSMRGNLHLSGNTNLSYILRESPLTIQDRMSGLVTFSYFQDTVPRRNRLGFIQRGEGGNLMSVNNSGMDMLMTIQIDPAVKFKVDLDEDASDRIELQGGGDLSFQYTKQGDMLLTGRYTLSNGLIKYTMPIISNKTLAVKENSYVEWTGDPMDPYLNVKATERVRTYVSSDGQSSRLVNFDAGVEVKQRMENLSLQFTLDAMDDATMQNQLTAMGAEERSKQAVGLLLTGMYLGTDQTGKMNLNMGGALSSFLESEINNLAGDLLGGVDFSFGMESYNGEGPQRTDYSFRFSKRFYNDRLNIILGGIVSSGGDAQNQNNSFINDAALEYRLDTGGSRYAKLFYNRKYESLLEGEIARYGGGFVFRRKMRHLRELFMFWDKKSKVVQEAAKKEDK